MISPLASIAPDLLASGYSPLPIMPGEKAPGIMVGDDWRFMTGWSKFCLAPPSSFQVGMWSKWPRAGVGVACGRGLIGLDLDRDEIVEPILAVVPPVVVAKRGRKGATLFFRGDTDAIVSRGYKIDGLGVMDVISHGKQTVLPPSIHAVTGLPYEWTTERTLGDTPLAELSELTVEHMAAVIEVLKTFGYEGEPAIEASAPREIDEDGDVEFYRQLNLDALASLGAWVPKLGLSRLQRSGDGFRSVAEWRASNSGNPIHKRPLLLAIKPNGIVDFGDGDKGYTPLNLVMAAFDADLDLATRWLGESIGRDFTPKIVLNRNRNATASQPRDALTGNAYRDARDGAAAEVVDDQPDPFADLGLPDRPSSFSARPKPAPAPEPAKPPAEPVVLHPPVREAPDPEQAAEDDALTSPDRLVDLTRIPGLVGEIIDWIEASAAYPSRELALGAALGWVAALAGRGFEAGDQRARTNLYMVGLAPSGFGKDHAGSCVTTLAQKVGLDRYLGPARFMSASGLRRTLMEQPSILALQDEFGGILRQIDGPKVGLHNEQIKYDLLGMFSRAKDAYMGSAYANESAIKLYNPNLCIYGMSTPDDFWSALSSARNADGFLPRFLIFNVDGPKPQRVKPKAFSGSPPESLIKGSRAIFQAVYGTGNLAGMASGASRLEAKMVGFAPGAEEALNALEAQVARAEAFVDARFHPIVGRAREHAFKLALTVAVGVDPANPVISVEVAEWAAKLAWYCACLLCREGSMRIADNERQRCFLKVLDFIRKAGANGIARGRIVDKLAGTLDKRMREELIEEAEASGRVVVILHKPPVGRPSQRYVAKEFRPNG